MAIDVIDHGSYKELVVWQQFRKHLHEDLARALEAAVETAGPRGVHVNLDAVATLSSRSLEALLAAAARLEARGRRLTLTGVGETVREILEATRLTDRFAVSERAEGAKETTFLVTPDALEDQPLELALEAEPSPEPAPKKRGGGGPKRRGGTQ